MNEHHRTTIVATSKFMVLFTSRIRLLLHSSTFFTLLYVNSFLETFLVKNFLESMHASAVSYILGPKRVTTSWEIGSDKAFTSVLYLSMLADLAWRQTELGKRCAFLGPKLRKMTYLTFFMRRVRPRFIVGLVSVIIRAKFNVSVPPNQPTSWWVITEPRSHLGERVFTSKIFTQS